MDRRRLLTATAFLAAGTATAPEAAPAAAAGMRFDHVSLNVRDFDAALA